MSTKFRTETIKKLHSHEIWGIFCTNAAGMGLDLHDVELVVQWKYTQSLCMLWQHLGHAARDSSKEATGVYIIEPQYMDHHRIQAGQRAASQTDKAQKRQLQDTSDTENMTSQGQVRMGDKKVGLCRRKKPCHQSDLAGLESGAGVPWATGKLIVQEERHQNYEVAAMEAYINVCPQGVCYHGITNEFFGNTPVSLSMACFDEDCPHCVVKASWLCCGTCNPGSFILPLPTTSAPKQTRAPNKFKVGQFELTNADKRLESALQDWWSTQLVNMVGNDTMFGPQLIMTDDVLERLVGLAHFKQVSDLASIHAQKHSPSINPASSRPILQPAENLPGPSTVH
ncbi:hypothetical protein BJY52DRAFT_1196608 [Lactarius psammicola]|nr:hypothetical protein BJY52DRAFT_1196608 [Lactarius psammicola]